MPNEVKKDSSGIAALSTLSTEKVAEYLKIVTNKGVIISVFPPREGTKGRVGTLYTDAKELFREGMKEIELEYEVVQRGGRTFNNLIEFTLGEGQKDETPPAPVVKLDRDGVITRIAVAKSLIEAGWLIGEGKGTTLQEAENWVKWIYKS